MKKTFYSVMLLSLLSVSLVGCNNKKNDNSTNQQAKLIEYETVSTNEVLPEDDVPNIEEVDYSNYFSDIEGCAVFYNYNSNKYQIYNKELSDIQASPCSTFKIITTLMGLENRIISSADSTMNYDGTIYPMDNWNKDLNLKEAFQYSCVWYFKKIIEEIGQNKVQLELNQLKYGNCDIDDWTGSNINSLPELNGFWLESSLKISVREQVDILAKVFNEKTHYSKKNIETLKDIMFIEKNKDLSIYGKTGTGKQDNAWFVGMVENDINIYYFAIHLSDLNKNEISGVKAKEIALSIIYENYIY